MSAVYVPRISGPRCLISSTYTCTRAMGHTGRHAATGTYYRPGLGRPVFRVWPQEQPAPLTEGEDVIGAGHNVPCAGDSAGP